ncbi:MAG: glycoside hydrolase family 3 protein [Ruminococcaceae bacterium]|nr:glycoside hydrolase family 3 protein [Oscillospiraceae bacterium]
MDFKEASRRAAVLVEKMTAEEKISQLLYNSPAIERLGIKEHNWWNEALHGVARAGTATVFPQTIGMAASFDPDKLREAADVISTEARAKYNQSDKFGDHGIYKNLTFWSPNINIFRDPRWGRGQETYGEDPFLTAMMGCAFIGGIQGDGEFLKAAACAKHFAVHSGPEKERHFFDAVVSKQDLWETYLPAFEWAVTRANVRGIMGAYNRTNGQPCCAHTELMGEILFGKWNFEGYFVSDCGAIHDIFASHHYTDSHVESAAVSLKRGCDLNCGEIYTKLIDAYETDLITDEDLTRAATHLYAIRFMLGEFEEERPYSDIPFTTLDCPSHRALNLEMAKKTLVLLKNEDNFLPLSPEKVKTIAAVGPNVQSVRVLEGNYEGRASHYITVADGIRDVFTDSSVYVADGCKLSSGGKGTHADWFSVGSAAASNAEVTVLCVGLDSSIEGEEGAADSVKGYCDGGDRLVLTLPPVQRELVDKICDVTDNLVIVIMAGSPVDVGERARAHAKAIIQAWYPGAVGGRAIAELLAGRFSPSARMPITLPTEGTLPDFTDYSMDGRTYRFLTDAPEYPFGYGLGYTDFRYENLRTERTDEGARVTVTVTNTGGMAGEEPVQIYAKYADSRFRTPNCQLCGIKTVKLAPGESSDVIVDVDDYWLKTVDNEGNRVDPEGGVTLYAGGHQPDARSDELTGYACLRKKLEN